MNEPTFDRNGYPTEETEQRIREWVVAPVGGPIEFEAAMDFVGLAWSYPEYWTKDPSFIDPDWPGGSPNLRYVFSTGGWSGNESLVNAIEENQMLQLIGAWSWRRGGHYEYRFPIPPAALEETSNGR